MTLPLEFLEQRMSDHRRPNVNDRLETAARAFAGTIWDGMNDEQRQAARRRVAPIIEALDARLAPPVLSADWPCRHEPAMALPPRLRSFLYLILRDYVQPGDVEQAALQSRDAAESTTYTNPHLVGYADSLASYLLDTGLMADDHPAPDFGLVERVAVDQLKSGDLVQMTGQERWRRVSVRHGADDAGAVKVAWEGIPGWEIYPPHHVVPRVRREHLR